MLNLDATMSEHAGAAYAGMDRYACREQVVRDLQALGRLEKIEALRHAIGHCTRCDIIVEPLVSRQWWLEAKPLAEPPSRRCAAAKFAFCPSISSASITTGWRTFAIGASRASSVGAPYSLVVLRRL